MELKLAVRSLTFGACLFTSFLIRPPARGGDAHTYPPIRTEFKPGAAERGEADEPDIATMGVDWSRKVEIRATVDRKEFRQLQRVRVDLDVKNVSGRRFWWPAAGNNRYLSPRIRVFDIKGKLVPMTQFYKNEGREIRSQRLQDSSSGPLDSGKSFRVDLVPNLIFDMTRPGEYWVLVELLLRDSFPPDSKENTFFYARAKPIKVKVTPEVYQLLPKGQPVLQPDRP